MSVETTKIGEDDDGELHIVWPDGDVDRSMAAKIASTPQTEDKERGDHVGETGPVPRVSSRSSIWDRIDMRSFALNSTEFSTTLKRFRDEMYRNQFPVLLPRFSHRCTECATEYDEERDGEPCEVCGNTEYEGPSKAQKYWLKGFLEAVNDDEQSLASLMKYEEDYQSTEGVSTILARLKYQLVERDVQVAGRSVQRTSRWEPTEIKELVHAEPGRILPVLDDKNRHGGWWTCPKHRGEYWETEQLTFEGDADHPVECCPRCQAQLEEVGYAEVDRATDVRKLYLKHEVIDWARHFPLLNGRDGRSPLLPLIKLQAILQYSRNYELQYLNPQNDQQLPDKFLVAYGKDVQKSLRASLKEEERKNPWEEGRLMYEGSPDDVEIELLDLSTSSGINGREPMVERLMSQIRAMFGVTDAFENELADTGGLNAEGTQVEITNAAIASAHQDTKEKALDKLCRLVAMVQGHCDWEITYVDPETEQQSLSPLEVLKGIEVARDTGTKVSVEDGQLQIPDQDIDPVATEPEPEPEPGPAPAPEDDAPEGPGDPPPVEDDVDPAEQPAEQPLEE